MIIFGKPFGTWNFTQEIDSIEDDSTKDSLMNDLCTLLIILEEYGIFFPKKIKLKDDVQVVDSSSFEYDIQDYIILDKDDYKDTDYWFDLFHQFNHVEKKNSLYN